MNQRIRIMFSGVNSYGWRTHYIYYGQVPIGIVNNRGDVWDYMYFKQNLMKIENNENTELVSELWKHAA